MSGWDWSLVSVGGAFVSAQIYPAQWPSPLRDIDDALRGMADYIQNRREERLSMSLKNEGIGL